MVNTHGLKQNNQITYNIHDTTFQKVAVRHGSNTFSLVWNAEVSDELRHVIHPDTLEWESKLSIR